MSVSYLDVVHSILATEGLTYGQLTKAMKVHVRSLLADGYVGNITADGDWVALDNPEGVVWFTKDGIGYADALIGSGLLVDPRVTADEPEAPVESAPVQEAPKAPRKGRRRGGRVTVRQTVPTPAESVQTPVVAPEVTVERRVPGNQHGDQLLLSTVSEDDRVAALERKVSALMAVLAS